MGRLAYPTFSVSFWRSYLVTMRPYLMFVSGAAGMVGLAFSGNQSFGRIILASIPLFLSYGFGQALTDCFQTDTDSISAPYRPLTKGAISEHQVITVSLAGLAIGVIIMGLLNPAILVLGAVSVMGLLTYTILKRTWWGGPPWNSWIVALLPLMGFLAGKETPGRRLIDFSDSGAVAFVLSVLAVFFAYANFVVMGYFKDINADRTTGYRTFPVVFGWTPAAIYSDVTALAAAVSAIAAIVMSGKTGIAGLAVLTVGVAINLYAQIGIHQTREEWETHRYIVNVVRTFIIYCASLIITIRPGWVMFLAIYYVAFEVALRLRPDEKQV